MAGSVTLRSVACSDAKTGASSNTRWQFVPPIPKELMPQRLGERSSVVQSRKVVFTYTGDPLKSMDLLGFWKFSVGGSFYFKCQNRFNQPCGPGCFIKMADIGFNRSDCAKLFLDVYRLKAFWMPLISMGSPSSVPVPCGSK